MKTLVVFAPHPDDETLGCGGTIAKKIHEDYEVFVVYMTDGRYALEEVGENKALDPMEMRELRRKDALKAAEILGLKEKNLFFLEIEDKTLKKHKDYIRKMVFEIVKDIQPTEVYFPQRKEYNLDHQVTHIIVKEVLKSVHYNSIKYQYAIAWTFPYYLINRLLPERVFYFIMGKILKCDLIQINISKFILIKKKALQAYESQTSLFSKKQKRAALSPSFISRFLKIYEKFFVEH